MKKNYRRIPVEVRAIQWTGENTDEVWNEFGAEHVYGPTATNPDQLIVSTLHGAARANVGDWIIQGTDRLLDVMTRREFRAAYERIPTEG